MIYTVAWNKIMYELKTDATVTAAYPKDYKGNVLHQTLEETTYGVTLKGHVISGGRFTLDKRMVQMMDVMNVAGTGLGNGVRFVFRDNVNIKRTDTFTYNNDEINLYSDVDWVFSTLQTPSSAQYIPEKVYKHVDINCDVIEPQQVNNSKKYTLYHAEIPGDSGYVVPNARNYMKLRGTSFTSLQIWISNETGSIIPTLPFEKVRVTLHFRKKKPLQTM